MCMYILLKCVRNIVETFDKCARWHTNLSFLYLCALKLRMTLLDYGLKLRMGLVDTQKTQYGGILS